MTRRTLTLKMCVRRLICERLMRLGARLLVLSVGSICACPQGIVLPDVYLLAATPTVYRANGYPATVYSIDAKQKLRSVYRVVHHDSGVQFVLLGPTFLAIGYPAAVTNTAGFVKYAAPTRSDSVQFGTLEDIEAHPPLGAFLIDDQVKGWMVGLPFFKNGATRLSGVLVQPGARSRVQTLDWSEVENLRFDGSIGGADIGFGTLFRRLGQVACM